MGRWERVRVLHGSSEEEVRLSRRQGRSDDVVIAQNLVRVAGVDSRDLQELHLGRLVPESDLTVQGEQVFFIAFPLVPENLGGPPIRTFKSLWRAFVLWPLPYKPMSSKNPAISSWPCRMPWNTLSPLSASHFAKSSSRVAPGMKVHVRGASSRSRAPSTCPCRLAR